MAVLRVGPNGARPLAWLVAAVVVAACWVVGSLVDTSNIAYGQTVPGPAQVSESPGSNGIAKRRPQLAIDSATGIVYMVWEQGPTATHGSDLWYAWRNAGGAWSVPEPLPGSPSAAIPETDTGRFGAGTPVNELYAHIQVDAAGNLHVVYAAQHSGAPVTDSGAYYTVGMGLTGAPVWTTPLRLDWVAAPGTAGIMPNPDNTRLFVRTDPGPTGYPAVGYVLWAGNSPSGLKLTRVGYGPGHATTLMDASPLANPFTQTNGNPISAGPVAVLERDATTLQLVYATKNTQAGGNGFWGAPLTLNADGTLVWGTRISLTPLIGDDCSAVVCTGATAVRDSAGDTWVVANYDISTTHTLRATPNGGAPAGTAAFLDQAAGYIGRQPVVAHDSTTGNLVVAYTRCTPQTATSGVCVTTGFGREIYFNVLSGGAWSGPQATGVALAGDQKEITAAMYNGDLYIGWTGTNQNGAGTGDHTYHQVVTAPS